MKKFLGILFVAVMVMAMGATAFAASNDGNVLKGSGSPFDYKVWSNIFYVSDSYVIAKDVTYWHFVDSGSNGNKAPEAKTMTLTFNGTDGATANFDWLPEMKFSLNGGGKNPGWVVVTPSNFVSVTGYLANALNQFNLSGLVKNVANPNLYPMTVHVEKFVTDANNQPGDPSGFVFDIFPASGPFNEEDIIATATSNVDGNVEFYFETGLVEGVYIVRERDYTEYYMPVEDLTFTVNHSVAGYYSFLNNEFEIENIEWPVITPPDPDEVDKDEFAKLIIQNHGDYNIWQKFGILCYYGQKGDEYPASRIIFLDDFFSDYASVVIRLRYDGNRTIDVTFTNINGIIVPQVSMPILTRLSDKSFEITIHAQTKASIVKLVKLPVQP
jgi:hypothetical protein